MVLLFWFSMAIATAYWFHFMETWIAIAGSAWALDSHHGSMISELGLFGSYEIMNTDQSSEQNRARSQSLA